MKRKILQIYCLLLSVVCGVTAQVTEDSRTMSLGTRNAIILDLPDTDARLADKLWKDFVKPYRGRSKKNRRDNEWLTSECKVSGVDRGKAIDLYARAQPVGNDTELIVWVDYGDQFLNSVDHPGEFAEAEQMLLRFADLAYKEKIELEVKEEEKTLKTLESRLKKLKKENDRYHKEIEQARKRIEKAESNIESNLAEQEETQNKIEEQKEQVQTVRNKQKDF